MLRSAKNSRNDLSPCFSLPLWGRVRVGAVSSSLPLTETSLPLVSSSLPLWGRVREGAGVGVVAVILRAAATTFSAASSRAW